ncbi:MAG: B12-binding domain-containing radical SAM protein [Candidatus Riflebacteria bacterium]|nr:B12-binding domain-containing radical SAM protein [Candidatus Riflebacteria bacterium]
MKILLINAVNSSVEVENRYPHLGFGYLISYARKVLFDIVLDFRVIEVDSILKKDDFIPDIVGISSVSQNFSIACKISDFYAERKIPVIIGGIHITVMPESLPESALAGCLGEGEETFSDILKLCAEGKLLEKLKTVPGIAYRENGCLKYTAERSVIKNLDGIPFPERDHMVIKSHAHMFTSRGCPYRCVFCASSRFWNRLRYFSAEYTADEIEFLFSKYSVRLISFFDDLFVADRDRMRKLIQILRGKGLLGKIKYTVNCRANLVDKELAALMNEMGIVSVGMGLESGNDATLKYLKTGNVTVEQNFEAVSILKDAGIFANASFVIGSPNETEKQIRDTYQFIRKSRLDLFDVYFLTPYPGTPVWEYALKKGIVSNDMKDWSRLDVNAYRDLEKVIFVSETIPSEKLVRLYKKFQKMRFWRNITKVWGHPLLHMVPRIILMNVYDYFKRLLKRML